jgi:hypothetical protein
MGGNKGKIFERTAALGDGWFAPASSPDELAPFLEPLKAACSAVDRDYTSIEITAMWPGQGGVEAVNAFAELGVSRLVVPIMALGADPAAGIQRLGEEVIAKL